MYLECVNNRMEVPHMYTVQNCMYLLFMEFL